MRTVNSADFSNHLSLNAGTDITPWELPCDQRGEVGGYKVDKGSRTIRLDTHLRLLSVTFVG